MTDPSFDQILHINLLGTPYTLCGGQPFELVRRQARALLYYLANTCTPVSRDKLLYLFWPDEPESKARRNLARLSSYLRVELPRPEILQTTRESLQINPERVQVDTLRFVRLCEENATHEGAVPLYRGPFLMGFSLASSPDFDFWLTEEQGRYETLYLNTLASLVRTKIAQSDWAAAIQYAQRYLTVDALAEEIHRKLITLYAAQGDRTAALKQYETCVQVLEKELGVSPLPETHFAYESVLKGSHAPALPSPIKPAWTVLPSLGLPLLGRKDAWEALESASQQLHPGGVILISGEAGVGKTRLLQEFATQGNGTILTGNNHPSTQTLPYHSLLQALRQALSQTHLWTDIPPLWLGELTQLLPELSMHFPDLPRPLEIEPQQAQARLFEALRLVFFGLAARASPLLLCLDDLHWADETTLDWLSAVSRRLKDSQMCVLGTYRSEDSESLQEARRAFRRVGMLVEVTLLGLTPQAINEILERVSGDGSTRAQLASRLYQATGGNTFFVLETVRKLLESEQLDAPPETLPLPKTVQETIQARLARLSPLSRQILDAAAVLSPDLKLPLLQQTAGRTELEALDGLDELIQRQLLQEEGEGLAFRHDLLRTSVYRALSPWRRQALHRRAGDALRDVYPSRPETVAAQRAQHYDTAGDYEQAVAFYEQAAAASQAVYAHGEAVRHLQRAIALVSKTKLVNKKAATLYDALADSLAFLGRFPAAYRAYQSACELLPQSESGERANVVRKQASTLVPQQKYEEAVNLYRKAIKVLDEYNNMASLRWRQVWLNTHLGFLNALYWSAQPEKMSKTIDAVQGKFEQYGTPSQRFSFLEILDRMQMRRDRFRPTATTIEHRKLILDHHIREGNPTYIASAHFGYAFMLLWDGDFANARHHFNESLTLAEKFAYGLIRVQCLTYLMVLHRLQGRTSLVQEMWPSTHEAAEEIGFPTYIGSSLANRAWLNYCKRQWEAAEMDAQTALEYWGSSPYPLRWLAYWVLLASALHENHLEEAINAADGLLDPVQQHLSNEVMAALERATERWMAQDEAEALASLELAVNLAREKGYL